MSAQIKDGGAVDVLADLQGVVRIAKAASLGVTGNKPRIERAEQAIAAVAELIEQMRDVLELWDSNSMSIDGKAATMQCRPEKWRAALANVGGTK